MVSAEWRLDMKQITFAIFITFFCSFTFAQRLPSAMQAIGTDSSYASIPLNEVLSGGPPPQGIPALGFSGDWQGAASATNQPEFVSQEEAASWLGKNEPVIVLVINGEAKAYPLQILTWHEIANDTVGGVPVAVTFCPLCNSALAFDRRIPLTTTQQAEVTSLNADAQFTMLDENFLEAYFEQEGPIIEDLKGLEVTFGVSGMLYNSNMLMFDTHTSTLWSQLLGDAVVGTLNKVSLLRLPAQVVGFAEFRKAFPNSSVLSHNTGFRRDYGRNPYVGYDDVNSPAFLFRGVVDGRLVPKERIISIDRGEDVAAYPFTVLSETRVVNDSVNGESIVLFWAEGTNSALDSSRIANGQDVGAVGVFSRDIADKTLTFMWDGETFIDEETGSTWNLLGNAVSGELAGQSLKPIVHDNTLWFAWAAFKPETRIFGVSN